MGSGETPPEAPVAADPPQRVGRRRVVQAQPKVTEPEPRVTVEGGESTDAPPQDAARLEWLRRERPPHWE